MTTGVSIIIPCYNSAAFLPDALESVWEYNGKYQYEIIVVDDGSTDTATLELLEKLKTKQNVQVLSQSNGGPAAARNTGIKKAAFEQVLFLDSDNRIRANKFIDIGIDTLEKDNSIGVVYGNAHFFGDIERNRNFLSKPFDMKSMFGKNFIDMCSMVRKKALADVGGLDENRFIIGHEDWDLWLRIAKCDWKFHYCSDVLFDYRIRKNSLIEQTISSKSHENVVYYILAKHLNILPKYYLELYSEYEKLQYLADLSTVAKLKHYSKNKIKQLIGWKQS